MRQLCVLALTIFSLIPLAKAQQDISRNAMFVAGEVSQERGALPDDLVVEVYNFRAHEKVAQAMVHHDGRFRLQNLPPGTYWVKIVNFRGDVIKESLADINQNLGTLSFRIPSPEPEPGPGGIVSVARILHPIPPNAIKELIRSQKAYEEGQMQQSVEHLEKAIQIFPDYTEAHNSLGARYLRMSQPDKAMKEFETAAAIDPRFLMARVNVAVTWLNKRDFARAEDAARLALQLDSQSAPAHYVLGQALAAQDKNAPEAIDSLRKSLSQFPKLRLLIAQLLVRQGAISAAAAELRAYLPSAPADKKKEIEAWLADLEQ